MNNVEVSGRDMHICPQCTNKCTVTINSAKYQRLYLVDKCDRCEWQSIEYEKKIDDREAFHRLEQTIRHGDRIA